jgi:hypothetical protein
MLTGGAIVSQHSADNALSKVEEKTPRNLLTLATGQHFLKVNSVAHFLQGVMQYVPTILIHITLFME